jgi:hypothetical protein
MGGTNKVVLMPRWSDIGGMIVLLIIVPTVAPVVLSFTSVDIPPQRFTLAGNVAVYFLASSASVNGAMYVVQNSFADVGISAKATITVPRLVGRVQWSGITEDIVVAASASVSGNFSIRMFESYGWCVNTLARVPTLNLTASAATMVQGSSLMKTIWATQSVSEKFGKAVALAMANLARQLDVLISSGLLDIALPLLHFRSSNDSTVPECTPFNRSLLSLPQTPLDGCPATVAPADLQQSQSPILCIGLNGDANKQSFVETLCSSCPQTAIVVNANPFSTSRLTATLVVDGQQEDNSIKIELVNVSGHADCLRCVNGALDVHGNINPNSFVSFFYRLSYSMGTFSFRKGSANRLRLEVDDLTVGIAAPFGLFVGVNIWSLISASVLPVINGTLDDLSSSISFDWNLTAALTDDFVYPPPSAISFETFAALLVIAAILLTTGLIIIAIFIWRKWRRRRNPELRDSADIELHLNSSTLTLH